MPRSCLSKDYAVEARKQCLVWILPIDRTVFLLTALKLHQNACLSSGSSQSAHTFATISHGSFAWSTFWAQF